MGLARRMNSSPPNRTEARNWSEGNSIAGGGMSIQGQVLKEKTEISSAGIRAARRSPVMKYGMGSDGRMGETLLVFFLPSICVSCGAANEQRARVPIFHGTSMM
ncbi:hypothetical protein RB213_011246 [Colletotrichum asianum]